MAVNLILVAHPREHPVRNIQKNHAGERGLLLFALKLSPIVNKSKEKRIPSVRMYWVSVRTLFSHKTIHPALFCFFKHLDQHEIMIKIK